MRILFWIAALLFIGMASVNLIYAPMLGGESAILANVPINFLQTGEWRYPFHAQELFFPGVEVFMIHPPLHYLFGTAVLWIGGVSQTALLLTSTAEGIAAIGLISVLVWRLHSVEAAVASLVIAMTSGALFTAMGVFRTDLAFGLMFLVLVCTQWLALKRERGAFWLGLALVGCLATHWFGFFFSLYVPIAVAAFSVLYKGRWWRPTLWLFGGAAIGFALWSLLYGTDLPMALLVAVLRGGNFIEIINYPMSHYLRFIWEWEGGWILAGACALGLIAVYRKDRLALLIFGNLVIFHLCFWLFVGSKKPTYSGNVLPLLIAFGGLGVAEVLLLVPRHKRQAVLAAAVGTIAIAAMPAHMIGLVREGGAFIGVERDYEAVLKQIIPPTDRVLMGGAGYQFLHDRPYVSTMRLVADAKMPKPGATDFGSLVAYYRSNPYRGFQANAFTLDERKEAVSREADAIVLGATSHAWQDLFVSPAVWAGTMKEVATVFLADRGAYERATAWNRLGAAPTVLTVIGKMEAGRGCETRGRVIACFYDDDLRSMRLATPDMWAEMTDGQRQEHVRLYLATLAGPSERIEEVTDFIGRVMVERQDSEGEPDPWTFGRAIDTLIESYGFPASLQ